MSPCFLRCLPFLFLAAAPLRAQNGDIAGEAQASVPAHWVIPPAPVLSPADEAKTFKLAPGFRVELVAAEPLVRDPIAMQFGPDGRVWVVEMPGYMRDINATGDKDPIGRIVVLSDTDGDGRMDKRVVFLDGLVLVRALCLVDGGLLFAEPPKLWFARDTDGDGVADSKVEVAADYGGTGNVEHLPNGLLWAMDNWIYNANHTSRYRYEGNGKFSREATISRGQWGITQDDVGRIYYNSNSDPLRADLVPAAYFRRNPNLTTRTGTGFQLAPPDLPLWPGRITPGVNRGYKTLRPDGTLPAVTAACSPVIYRGTLFPREFWSDAFICDPSVNVVKRIVLVERDATVRGSNAYEKTEFMTSRDERFRPVSIYNGPDGALWLVDIYRGVIQERTYVTSYLRKQIDQRGLAQPTGLGRLWRIVPEGAPPAKLKLSLDRATPTELVQALGHSNGWTRDTAQRLLVEKRGAGVAPATIAALREFAAKAENPLGRLHALWTLDGLGAVDRAVVLGALGDRDARVCTAAVRLAEKFLQPAIDGEIFGRLRALAVHPETMVRLQLAFSLGEARSPEGDAVMRELLGSTGFQAFLADAILSGLAGREEPFVEALVRGNLEASPATTATVAAATSAVMKSKEAARIARVLALASDAKTAAWARTAVLDGVERFIPKMSNGRVLTATLPAEPAPLVALAAQAGPESARAGRLLESLRWPGKAGMAAAQQVKLSAEEQARFDKGKAQFAALCAACHQPEGQGLPGLAPALVNSRWLLGDERITARIVLVGKARDNLTMPGLRAVLDDEAIASVLTFARNSWGHTAGAVSPAVVAEARAATLQREDPFGEDGLVSLEKSLNATRRKP